MILDTSALLAILLNEPEEARFLQLMTAADVLRVSAASVLEASLVLEGRQGEGATGDLDELLLRLSAEIVPFDANQLFYARMGFRKYGKGKHPAKLNFGDCISYGLAKAHGEPLLFKGADFGLTDVADAAGST